MKLPNYTNEKDIKNGNYRNFYVVYNRKSTDEPNNQKNSLTYQKDANFLIAKQRNLLIAPITIKNFCNNGIVAEKHSGFKENAEMLFKEDGTVQFKIDRPKFHKMVSFLNAGFLKGVIVLCWDRISRNKGDNTIVEKLIKQGVDVQFVQASYERTSAGALHRDIEGTFAEHHSRTTSEKVKLTFALCREKGLQINMAPIGYLNQGIDSKPLDPIRAPIIKRLFELYASGEWSLNVLSNWANDHGLRTVARRRRRTKDEILSEDSDEETNIPQIQRLITPMYLSKIFKNQFYTGKVLGPNKMYVPSKCHKALISEDIFNKVQIILRKKNVSIKYTNKINLPYRGLIRCESCDRAFNPYVKKSVFYYGLKCSHGCLNSRKSMNKTMLEQEIQKSICELYFTDKEVSELQEFLTSDVNVIEDKRQEEIEDNGRQKKDVQDKLNYLSVNKLSLLQTGVYSPEDYLKTVHELNHTIQELDKSENFDQEQEHKNIQNVLTLSELIKSQYLLYSFANTEKKERITRIMFSELFVFDNTFKFICRNGFKPFKNRFVANSAPKAWLSEFNKYSEDIQTSIDELKSLEDNS